jgi:hypothetical protein
MERFKAPNFVRFFAFKAEGETIERKGNFSRKNAPFFVPFHSKQKQKSEK